MSVDGIHGLLLRVGIDKGTGGCLAPIFEDGSFEYIPIPETWATSESSVYKSMKGRCGKSFADFVGKNYRYSHPHHDPEFTTYTYGDPAFPKRNQLSKLQRPGGILIFYAGLEPKDWEPERWVRRKGGAYSRLFVIGYFTVEKVYDFQEIPKSQREQTFDEVPNNAHSKQYERLKALNVEYSDDSHKDLVIVRGCPKNSALFRKALPLGDDDDYPLENVRPIIGPVKFLGRGGGHVIDKNHIQTVKKWLQEWLEQSNVRDDKPEILAESSRYA